MEPAYPAFFAVMSRPVQSHPKIQTKGYKQTLNLTFDDAMCYSHGVHAIASASVADAPSYTEQERRYLQQEFSLERGASEQEIPKKNI